MGPVRRTLLHVSENRRLAEKLSHHPLLRRTVTRFMPGEELEDALAAAERLNEYGITSVLTLLGEKITERKTAKQVTHHYRHVLETVKDRSLDCHISVKLTQLGLAIDPQLCSSNLSALVSQARDYSNSIWIDMEESAYVDATLHQYRLVRKEYSNVGLCLQSYLYRTAEDLSSLLSLGPTIRLVKGAYAESPHIAYRSKKEVDKNFLQLFSMLVSGAGEERPNVAIATHDPDLIDNVRSRLGVGGFEKDSLEYQMMYGIRRKDQIELAERGYRVRVLISYGSAWFPWYLRRLSERPANLFFVLRNLFRFR